MSTKLEKLQKQQAQIKAQIQQALAAERTAEKKKNTRRKFLIGDAVLAQMKSGELAEFDLSSVLYSQRLTTGLLKGQNPGISRAS